MSESSPPPPPGPGEEPAPATERSPWEEPWGESRNTGVPASAPPGAGPTPPAHQPPVPPGRSSGWDDWGGSQQQPQQQQQQPAQPGQQWAPPNQQWAPPGQQWGARPQFAAPDPAAVQGPPWPVLVAVGPYTPPRMPVWPTIAGAVVAVVYFVLIAVFTTVLSSSTSLSQAAWLADHDGTISALNRDQQRLITDNQENAPTAAVLADWHKFHQDAAAAASVPNPGGSATAPWREMINDYYNGSAEIIQAIQTDDQQLAARAQQDLEAGDSAARSFNQAMGINS